MKKRLLPAMLAVLGLTPLAPSMLPTANAAPVAAPYTGVMSTLAPKNYFPLDDTPGGGSGTLADDVGTANSTSAIYRSTVNHGGNFGGSTAAPLVGTFDNFFQAQSCCTAAGTVGSNIGPSAVNEFTTEGSAGWIAAQLPGFNPDYSASNLLDTGSTTVNRSAEFNRAFAIQLGPTANFSGNLSTGGAITWAGWVKSDGDGINAGTASEPIRIFDTGAAAADPGFFQVVTGGTAGWGIAVTGSGGSKLFAGDRDLDQGKGWKFIVASTDGSGDAAQLANARIWDGFSDRTVALSNAGAGFGASNEGNGTPAANSTRNAKLGYRDVSVDTSTGATTALVGLPGGSSATNGGFRQTFGGSMDEVAIWDRVLQTDEREALYHTATVPTGGPRTVTFTGTDPGAPTQYGLDANWDTSAILGTDTWIAAGANSTASFPGKASGRNQPYMNAVIDATAVASDLGLSNRYGAGVGYYPTNSLTVNATKSLTVSTATTMRSRESTTINGALALNGITGTIGNGGSRAAVIDSGLAVSIGSAATVTAATPFNRILAEGNLTINSGAAFTLTAMTGASATGAQLYTFAQADSNQGSGSALQEAGVFTGQFSSHTLPADEVSGAFRRVSVLYENRSASGVGTVDTMKIGFAQPGDMNFDSTVDFTDAADFGSWYGNPSGGNWRTGDFNADGATDFADAADFGAFYGGGTYATTPGSTVDGTFSIVYTASNGLVTIEGPGAQQYKVVNLTSASGLFIPGVAAWIPQPFQSNTTLAQGYSTIGAGLLTSNGYVIGQILPAGLTQAQLLADLTIKYAINGVAGPQQFGNLIYQVPEPSSFVLLAFGLAGMVARRRRRQAA